MSKHLIIHGFALAHALVVMMACLMGWTDDMVVTILTLTMIFLLCHIYRRSYTEAGMLSLVYVLLGYFLGTQGAQIVDNYAPNVSLMWSQMGVTFVLTEIYGWITYFIVRNGKPTFVFPTRSQMGSICTLYFCTLLYRIIFIDCVVMVSSHLPESGFYEEMRSYLDSLILFVPTMLLIVLITIHRSRSVVRGKSQLRPFFNALLISFLAAIPATVFTYWNNLLHQTVDRWEVMMTLLVVTFSNLIILIVTRFLFNYYQLSNQLQLADDQKHKAQYQYQQLKQQLNPHFLFNCLNILDYIVQAGEKERASAFIRKLANIYRYQLSMNDVRLVPIEEELRHTNWYIDLLQERFGNAFQVEQNVPEEYGELEVVPCSIQLMVENAQKHNVVNQQQPLKVSIYVEGAYVCVRNNIQPRRSRPDSTGIGLKNIQMQYMDIAKKDVIVENDGTIFVVKLPII